MTGKDGRQSPSEIWHAKTEHDATGGQGLAQNFWREAVAMVTAITLSTDIQTDQTAKGFSRQESLWKMSPLPGVTGD